MEQCRTVCAFPNTIQMLTHTSLPLDAHSNVLSIMSACFGVDVVVRNVEGLEEPAMPCAANLTHTRQVSHSVEFKQFCN